MRWIDGAALLLVTALAGCSFTDGDPWGEVDMSLEAAFEVPASRQTPEGWLKANNGYLIEVTSLEVELAQLEVRLTPLGEGALPFDPASPPPGYSLCHNGHCHHDDGRLVDYEEIALEQAQGAEASGGRVQVAIDRRVALGDPQVVALEPCDGGCFVDRGELSSLALVADAVHLQVRVRDGNAEPRIPEEGIVVTGAVPLTEAFTIPIEGRVDDEEPVGIRLGTRFVLTEKIFDDVDWTAGGPSAVDVGQVAGIRDTIDANIREGSRLETTVIRYAR